MKSEAVGSTQQVLGALQQQLRWEHRNSLIMGAPRQLMGAPHQLLRSPQQPLGALHAAVGSTAYGSTASAVYGCTISAVGSLKADVCSSAEAYGSTAAAVAEHRSSLCEQRSICWDHHVPQLLGELH